MKKLSLVLGLVLFCFGTMLAQRTLTGTITDADGEPLIGATVLVKGTSSGTVTDIDGSFSINVPEGGNTLVFSYTGFATQEMPIGTSDVLSVTMEETASELSEVVVTGLGIKKEKKALGYGVSTLSSELIEARPEADLAKILRGKATGVDIVQTSGLAGTGTNIIIRGYSSITGSNQPLFIVDGTPMNSETNEDRDFTEGGATTSSRFMDLDPNNIAEINILKGLSATVLYGEAGRNGVVLITTKTGNAGANAQKKLEIGVTQSVAWNQIANLPDYQNTYGNGFDGNFGWFFSNWGPAFDVTDPAVYGSFYRGEDADGTVLLTHPYDQAQYNDDVPEFIGQTYRYQPYESVENFFETGLTSNTSVSVNSQINETSSLAATYSYLDESGFTPKLDDQRGGGPSNFIKRHNFSLGAQTKLQNGINIKGVFNYVNSFNRRPITGPAFGSDGNGLFAALLFTPRSIDLLGLPYQSPVDGSNIYYRQGSAIQNPRWTLNNSADFETLQRFFGNIEVSYEIAPWLTALYRISLDQYSQNQERRTNKGGPRDPDGRLETSDRLNRVTDQVLNFLYNFNLGSNFTLDGVVGVNPRKEVRTQTFTNSTQQNIFELFTHQNFINTTGESLERVRNTIGLYGTISLGFRNFLYVNLQGRNDWTSLLERQNQSIFYPSASVSFIPTEAFPGMQNGQWLNYLKVRFSYGTSAGYPNPYQTRNILAVQTRAFQTSDGTLLNTNSVDDQSGNPNLTHELHEELEIGLEMRFLKNRVGFDLNLYDKTSSDLIINLDLDPATGFRETTVNAAQLSNRGIEAAVNITPFRGKVTWDMTWNFTKNVPEIESIAQGIEQVPIAGYTNLGNFAIPGEPYGVMQGTAFQRTDEGDLIVNNQGSYLETSDITIIGNPNPNWQGNWINNLTFPGGISVGWQFQYIDGGDIYSSTVQSLLARGNTVDTDVDRFLPIILPGVTANADGTFRENDIQAYIGNAFFDGYFGADEGGIFDATVIRLREVSIGWVMPRKWLENTPFGRIGLTASGQNLWYNAPNFPEGMNYDPEVLSLGVGNGRGFDFRTAPNSRRWALTLNVTF